MAAAHTPVTIGGIMSLRQMRIIREESGPMNTRQRILKRFLLPATGGLILAACGEQNPTAPAAAANDPSGAPSFRLEGTWSPPLTFVQVTCLSNVAPPGRLWTTDGGVNLHIRRQVTQQTVLPADPTAWTPIGNNEVVENLNVNTATGAGRAWGRAGFVVFAGVPGFGEGGGWKTSWNGRITGGMLSAELRGRGRGSMRGTRIKGRIEQFVPTAEQLTWMCDGAPVLKAVTVTGRVLSPGD